MSPLFDKLSAELRLQIYEDALQFDRPLRHLSKHPESSTEHSQTAAAAVSVSVLFTCKKAYAEALPVFYKLNTISLHHWETCVAADGKQIDWVDKDLIHKIQLVEDPCKAEPITWTCHWLPRPTYRYSYISSLFAGGTFPKLRSLHIILRGSYEKVLEGIDFVPVHQYLENEGLAITHTGLGCFKLQLPDPRHSVSFEYAAILAAWKHYSALPIELLKHHWDPPMMKKQDRDRERVSFGVEDQVLLARKHLSAEEPKICGVPWPATPGSKDYERLTTMVLGAGYP